jgi:hypothetical protein
MSGALLLTALLAGVGAVVIGWPAWRSYRERETRARNADRYLAWRGRADRAPSAREGMTTAERRRVWAGGVLAVVALACLVAGLAAG